MNRSKSRSYTDLTYYVANDVASQRGSAVVTGCALCSKPIIAPQFPVCVLSMASAQTS